MIFRLTENSPSLPKTCTLYLKPRTIERLKKRRRRGRRGGDGESAERGKKEEEKNGASDPEAATLFVTATTFFFSRLSSLVSFSFSPPIPR